MYAILPRVEGLSASRAPWGYHGLARQVAWQFDCKGAIVVVRVGMCDLRNAPECPLPSNLGFVDFGQFCANALYHLLLFSSSHIPPRSCADFAETLPFIHSKLSHSNFHIETIVILHIDIALVEVVPDHELMNFLASLDFGD